MTLKGAIRWIRHHQLFLFVVAVLIIVATLGNHWSHTPNPSWWYWPILFGVIYGANWFAYWQRKFRREQALKELSFRNVYITTPRIMRQRLTDLPYGVRIVCDRAAGWRVFAGKDDRPREIVVSEHRELLAGEFDGPDRWLILDINGQTIVDSRKNSPKGIQA